MKKQLKDLKQSEEILEIRQPNPNTVSVYRQAMRQGDKFPALVITPENIIVSGNTRYAAYCDEYPEDHEVSVEVRKYANHTDMIEDSIRENIRHGDRLEGIQKKRAIHKLLSLGKTAEDLSALLGMSVKRIEHYAGLYVIIRGGKERKPVKRGLEHMAAKSVTRNQYEHHERRDRAFSVHAQCNQLIRWIENGWVDMDDERNIESLCRLAEVIDEKVRAVA
jgi:hypothetical protein